METDLPIDALPSGTGLDDVPVSGCGIERTLQVLDGSWTTLVVRELLAGPKRFTELRRALGSPSAKTLTERLRRLEHQGVLTRTVHAEVPPRVVYALTERGHSLRVVLLSMLAWGETDRGARSPRDQHPPAAGRRAALGTLALERPAAVLSA